MTRRAWALFALMSVIWGVPYLLIKVAVEEMSPAAVAFGRVAIAAAVLLPIAARAGALRGLAARRRPIAFVAVVSIAVPFLLISAGEERIASSLTGLLIAAEPLILAGIAMRLHPAERVGRARLAGMLLGFVGVALLLGVEVGADRFQLAGAGLVLLATVFYAVGTLRISRDLSDLPPLGVVTAALTVSAVVLAPAAFLTAPSEIPDGRALAALAGLGVVCTAVAFVAFFALVAAAGAGRAAVITYVNPAVAVALGVLVLDEPLGAATVAGLLLVIAGSWFSTGGGLPPGARRALARRRARARRVPLRAPG